MSVEMVAVGERVRRRERRSRGEGRDSAEGGPESNAEMRGDSVSQDMMVEEVRSAAGGRTVRGGEDMEDLE
jgi:hypothetical protein